MAEGAAGMMGFGRAFGVNPAGFGDRFFAAWGGIVGNPRGVVPDDGAVTVKAGWSFVVGVPYRFDVRPHGSSDPWRACYSGVAGRGSTVLAERDGSVTFVVPGGLALGAHDIRVVRDGLASIVQSALTVRRRFRRSKSYELARLFPLPVFAQRGPVDPSQEAVWTPAAPLPAAPLYGPFRAVKEAMADALNTFGGLVMTRLRRDLPPKPPSGPPPAEALEAMVESTYGLPETGTVMVRGEPIAYSGTSDYLLTALVRDDAVRETYPTGEPVALWTRDASDLDLARLMMLVDTAEEGFLDVVGGNYGVPRLMDAPDALYRRIIKGLAYQAAKGTRTALDEIFALLMDGRGHAGADGVITANIRKLISVAGGFTAGMKGLRIRLDGHGRNRRTCRIARVVSATQVLLEDRGSAFWAPAALEDEAGVSFEVLPWDVIETPHKPCTVLIRLTIAPPLDATGFAYLQGGEEAESPFPWTEVTVANPIRQVLSVRLRPDVAGALGLDPAINYCTGNTFAGSTITVDTVLPHIPSPAPVPTPVIVDYGSVNVPLVAPTSGLPGEAGAPASAQIMGSVNDRNPGSPPLLRYPLYLGDRVGAIRGILDALTVAGVIPELEVRTW